MKKLLVLLLTAALFAACEGPMGPVGPAGKDGEVNKVYNDNLEIRQNQWKTGTDIIGPHYYADLLIPELDEYMIYDGDGLYQLTWRYMEDGVEIRQTLETTIYHKDTDGYLWSENISCQFSVGEARIIIRYSDFDMMRNPPQLMQFLFAGMY